MVITNQVLRYTFHKNPSTDGMVTYGEVDLPKGTIQDGIILNKPAFQEVVNRLVRQHKWKRKKLYFCIQDDTVVIRQLQIPASLSKEEARGYIKTQIGTSIYLPFANPAIAIDRLDTEYGNSDMLLFAYPKEQIAAFEAVFEEAGLKPVVADLTSLSVYRYYYVRQQTEHDHVLLIHWNHDALVLTAFQRHKAIFTRYMKIENEKVELSNETAKQIMDEFMIEIIRIIGFYQFSITKGEAEINLLLVSGDFPYLDTVKTTLGNRVTMPIYSFEKEELAGKYMDVLGLALKQDV